MRIRRKEGSSGFVPLACLNLFQDEDVTDLRSTVLTVQTALMGDPREVCKSAERFQLLPDLRSPASSSSSENKAYAKDFPFRMLSSRQRIGADISTQERLAAHPQRELSQER